MGVIGGILIAFGCIWLITGLASFVVGVVAATLSQAVAGLVGIGLAVLALRFGEKLRHIARTKPKKLVDEQALDIVDHFILVNALGKLANVCEEVLISKEIIGFIGADGVDALPLERQREINEKYLVWLARIRKHPRHKVTQELLKCMRVSQRSNRLRRVHAQTMLLEQLIEQGIAMDLETFSTSFAD